MERKRVLAKAAPLKTLPRARQVGCPTPGLFGRISRVWDNPGQDPGQDRTRSHFTASAEEKRIKLFKRLRYANITSTIPQACPRSSGIAPNHSTSASRHKQSFNQEQRTFSRAVVKSALFTLIRRSRNAIKPASVQIALMSAPDKSSFAITYSSRSTSSAKLIREVCNLEKQSVQ